MPVRLVRRSTRPLVAMMLVLALVATAHAAPHDTTDSEAGVRKLMRYLRCTIEILFANDSVTAGAAAVDCTALYLAEAH